MSSSTRSPTPSSHWRPGGKDETGNILTFNNPVFNHANTQAGRSRRGLLHPAATSRTVSGSASGRRSCHRRADHRPGARTTTIATAVLSITGGTGAYRTPAVRCSWSPVTAARSTTSFSGSAERRRACRRRRRRPTWPTASRRRCRPRPPAADRARRPPPSRGRRSRRTCSASSAGPSNSSSSWIWSTSRVRRPASLSAAVAAHHRDLHDVGGGPLDHHVDREPLALLAQLPAPRAQLRHLAAAAEQRRHVAVLGALLDRLLDEPRDRREARPCSAG